jgi:RimJ/RimL family protein N-acetyltransferase
MIELPPLLDERVVLRAWKEDDADWYAAAVRDPEIQRFTSEPEDLTAEQVRAGLAGEVSYWQTWPVVAYAREKD